MPDTDTQPKPVDEELHQFSDLPGIDFQEFDPDNPPEGMPDFLVDLLEQIRERLNQPHVHVSDVSFIMGDTAGLDSRVHVSFDAHGLNVPADREISTSAVFDYERLPDEVRDAWITVVRYLEDHLNSDPALFTRLQASVDSTLDCDIIVDTEVRDPLVANPL